MNLSINLNQAKLSDTKLNDIRSSKASSNNEKIEWFLYKLRQFGWKGSLGLILLLGTAFLLALLILPKSIELATLYVVMGKQNILHSSAQQVDSKKESLDVIQNFYALLPLQKEANNKITEILDAAKGAGLVFNKTEYMSQAVPASALIKYQINMPILGTYIQIRQFINSVLKAHPSLAFNTISLKRQDVNNDAVEANIQMTLYLQKIK